MIRQLGDVAARREAATAALQERLNNIAMTQLARSDQPVWGGVKEPSAENSMTVKEWIKDVTDAIQEAKQSGVASSLIEHAKLKVREKQRERAEQQRACDALRDVLAKKDVPTQEVLRSLKKAQRLQAKGQ